MIKKLILILSLALPVTATSCTGKANAQRDVAPDSAPAVSTTSGDTAAITLPAPPERPTGTAWIVISKRNMTLSVYDRNTAGHGVLVIGASMDADAAMARCLEAQEPVPVGQDAAAAVLEVVVP